MKKSTWCRRNRVKAPTAPISPALHPADSLSNTVGAIHTCTLQATVRARPKIKQSKRDCRWNRRCLQCPANPNCFVHERPRSDLQLQQCPWGALHACWLPGQRSTAILSCCAHPSVNIAVAVDIRILCPLAASSLGLFTQLKLLGSLLKGVLTAQGDWYCALGQALCGHCGVVVHQGCGEMFGVTWLLGWLSSCWATWRPDRQVACLKRPYRMHPAHAG